MSAVTRAEIARMMKEILIRQGKNAPAGEEDELETIGFRSLDFAELALRVENASGRSLLFEAETLRAIRRVGDVLDFLEQAVSKGDAS